MWELAGFLTAMGVWWTLTLFGTILALTYLLRGFAKHTGVHEFIHDVNKLCNKVTTLPPADWIGFMAISLIMWLLNSGPFWLTMPWLDENLWGFSVYLAERASPYAAIVLIALLYPLAILLVKMVYAVKPVLAKHKEAMDKINKELS